MALFVFLLMLYVSQSAALTVKVYEGHQCVTLPFTMIALNNDPSALWSREGSTPETVHLRDNDGDDLRYQSAQFKGRTLMRTNSLQTGDLSLTLNHPTALDSGTYTCVVKEGTTEVTRTSLQLIYISKQVTAPEGAESVSLPCTMRPLNINTNPAALWTREGSDVHRRLKEKDSKEKDDLRLQSTQFKGRTQMNPDALQTGDLSLLLFKTTPEDSGIYTCTVMEDTTQTGRISVKLYSVEVTVEPIPPPGRGTLIAGLITAVVLLVLLILVCVWYNRKMWIRSKVTVMVFEGDPSVSLPFKLEHGLHMDMDPSAKWTRWFISETVHFKKRKGDDHSTQSRRIRGRTAMDPDALQTGVLSLTLNDPTASDRGRYTCVVKYGTTEVKRISVELIYIKSCNTLL